MIGLKDSTSARIGQRWPLVLPGGRYVICAASNNSAAVPRLAVLDLQTKHSLTYLLISHDLGLVARMADHVAIMAAGRIVEQGPAAEVFANPVQPETCALVTPALRTGKAFAAAQGAWA